MAAARLRHHPPRTPWSWPVLTVGMVNAAFSHIFTRPLTTGEWAQIMILDKVARHQAVPQKDNLLDIAGYAACSFECDHEKLEDS